jgi:hypothetical protein
VRVHDIFHAYHYQKYGNREWPDVISEHVFPYFLFEKANKKILVDISVAKKQQISS